MPFGTEEIKQANVEDPSVKHIYIFLSGDGFDAEKADRLRVLYDGKDKFQIIGRDLYLLCFQSIRDSELVYHLTKLDRSLTARNLRTIKKIASMF